MFEIFLLGIFVFLVLLTLCFLVLSLFDHPIALHRVRENPILEPIKAHWWESEAVFNPAAFVYNNRVHLLYRALGRDGVSRIGYASSPDGIHFDERLDTPAYEPTRASLPDPRKIHQLSYKTLSYDTANNASGGGWGGSEDPRAIIMDNTLYMSFTAFTGWDSERMTLTWLPIEKFESKQWLWNKGIYLSPPGEVQKNWLLFPEKINGKYAILHSISPSISIDYFDSLQVFDGKTFIEGSTRSGGRSHAWDKVVRGAGAPPLKTPYGWLLFYHGFDPAHSDIGYKVGAMLLDLQDPTKILYRSNTPVLVPSEWYENDWKAGVAYASGAVIFKDQLMVYYGGGDKRIALAKMPLQKFLQRLMRPDNKQKINTV